MRPEKQWGTGLIEALENFDDKKKREAVGRLEKYRKNDLTQA